MSPFGGTFHAFVVNSGSRLPEQNRSGLQVLVGASQLREFIQKLLSGCFIWKFHLNPNRDSLVYESAEHIRDPMRRIAQSLIRDTICLFINIISRFPHGIFPILSWVPVGAVLQFIEVLYSGVYMLLNLSQGVLRLGVNDNGCRSGNSPCRSTRHRTLLCSRAPAQYGTCNRSATG
jgi:hypothetical protein